MSPSRCVISVRLFKVMFGFDHPVFKTFLILFPLTRLVGSAEIR